jgi:hypothetical protein
MSHVTPLPRMACLGLWPPAPPEPSISVAFRPNTPVDGISDLHSAVPLGGKNLARNLATLHGTKRENRVARCLQGRSIGQPSGTDANKFPTLFQMLAQEYLQSWPDRAQAHNRLVAGSSLAGFRRF